MLSYKSASYGALLLFLAMRKSIDFYIPDLNIFRKSAAAWASSFSFAAIFDSNKELTNEIGYRNLSSFDILIGVSNLKVINTIHQLKQPINDWLFGHLSYECFHSEFGISQFYQQKDGFQDSLFFIPEWIIKVQGNHAQLLFNSKKNELEAALELQKILNRGIKFDKLHTIKIKANYISKADYSSVIVKIKKHIARGDVYEMNFCIDFFTDNYYLDPLQTWFELCDYSPAPFSVFYKNYNAYLISASPERFLKKQNQKLFSQPIKGTIARDTNFYKDELNKKELLENPKERAENIMITDLVRNDLTPISEINSVAVDSLCELYSFKHVHQLISTISSTVSKEKSVFEILQSLFPMGSMTGAPKLNAIQLSSKYESFNRGLYSGSVGYIEPDGNFDFNVVIRSILYNEATHRISLPAGSAITMESIASKEYQECLVKISPLFKILNLDF